MYGMDIHLIEDFYYLLWQVVGSNNYRENQMTSGLKRIQKENAMLQKAKDLHKTNVNKIKEVEQQRLNKLAKEVGFSSFEFSDDEIRNWYRNILKNKSQYQTSEQSKNTSSSLSKGANNPSANQVSGKETKTVETRSA